MGHARDARFAARTQDDLLALLAAAPFGWLVGAGHASPLPLRAELDRDGGLVALRGHLARRNPQVAALIAKPQALAIVTGPHAYVSASWLSDRTQAPTWNYAAAVFELTVAVDESEAGIRAEVEALVTQMEAGRPNAWQLDDMGARYARLASGVSALRGTITGIRPMFKLGQDERAQDVAEILAGLDTHGGQDVADWMRRFAGTPGAQG